MADALLSEQRRITRVALQALGQDGFALAGSGAIREHGLIDRPTQDIDLFTVASARERFSPALDSVVEALEEHGYVVDVLRRSAGFAQLEVTGSSGLTIEMDLGVDWRAHAPVHLEVGPVLSIDDAVGNKIAALYWRGEVRDYLDADAIRQAERYSDGQLIELVRTSDTGFDLTYFIHRLDGARQLDVDQVADYGLGAADLARIKTRMAMWASTLRKQLANNEDEQRS